MKPLCKYCNKGVVFGPGIMLVEEIGGDSFATHEECYQMSGDDEGYVERLHKILEEREWDEEDI